MPRVMERPPLSTDRRAMPRPVRSERPSRWLFVRRRLRRWLRPAFWGMAALALLVVGASLLRTVQPGAISCGSGPAAPSAYGWQRS